MKRVLIPIVVTSLITITTFSGCNPFDWEMVHAPISAEINGVRYYSEGFESSFFDPNFPKIKKEGNNFYRILVDRRLRSPNNDIADISIYVYADSFKVDTLYTCNCYLGRHDKVEGKIYFSQIHPRLIGGFEFTSIDPETKEPYVVKNGKFNILLDVDMQSPGNQKYIKPHTTHNSLH